MPGGRLEPGETAAEAAVRELHEETGLDAVVVAPREVVEYMYPLTEEPAERRAAYDPGVATAENDGSSGRSKTSSCLAPVRGSSRVT